MAFTHLWDQFHLYRKQVTLLLFLVILASGEATAQKMIFQHNLPNHDNKRLHYGLYLGLHSARYKIQHSDSLVRSKANSSEIGVQPKFFPGFGGGLVLNVRLNNYMDLRLLPGVGFYSRIIEYKDIYDAQQQEPVTVEQEIGSLYVEFPLLLKYKSERRKNTRVYFVAGVKPGFDLTSKKKNTEDGGLRAQNQDLTIEYGIGLDLYYPFFKFSPELRFSHGLRDMRVPDNNIYSKSLQRMSTHTVTLYFFFES